LEDDAAATEAASRAASLQMENARLKRLVAELLAKNEELRRRYTSLTASD
jgi:hypothetical protein